MKDKLYDYIVYRVGSNAANQSMTHRMAIGDLESGRSRAAKAAALEEWEREHRPTVYANQFLTLGPVSAASPADLENAARSEEIDTLRSL